MVAPSAAPIQEKIAVARNAAVKPPNHTWRSHRATARLRRDVRQERVAAGVETTQADAAQTVGEHGGSYPGNEAEKNTRALKQQARDHDTCFAPTIGPMADEGPDDDAGSGEGGKHHADDKRRAAELRDIER